MAVTTNTTNKFIWDGTTGATGVIAQDVSTYMPTITEHLIQGKSVTHQLTYSEVLFEDNMVNLDVIKKELVQGLAEKMMHEKVIEFTMQDDHSMGTKICRARIFAVPDTQVKILREQKVI
jgi:hypothetical protein